MSFIAENSFDDIYKKGKRVTEEGLLLRHANEAIQVINRRKSKQGRGD